MFNVMVDAKDQSAKLCAMEMGQEVKKTTTWYIHKILVFCVESIFIKNKFEFVFYLI